MTEGVHVLRPLRRKCRARRPRQLQPAAVSPLDWEGWDEGRRREAPRKRRSTPTLAPTRARVRARAQQGFHLTERRDPRCAEGSGPAAAGRAQRRAVIPPGHRGRHAKRAAVAPELGAQPPCQQPRGSREKTQRSAGGSASASPRAQTRTRAHATPHHKPQANVTVTGPPEEARTPPMERADAGERRSRAKREAGPEAPAQRGRQQPANAPTRYGNTTHETRDRLNRANATSPAPWPPGPRRPTDRHSKAQASHAALADANGRARGLVCREARRRQQGDAQVERVPSRPCRNPPVPVKAL